MESQFNTADPSLETSKLKEGEEPLRKYMSEDEFVADFLSTLEDELRDFEDRVEVMIKTIENSSYYTSHDDELNKKEKEKFEMEQKAIEYSEKQAKLEKK